MSAVLENVTRNSVATEDVRVTDSVFIHDSIYIHEKGDTVREIRWRTCWRERTVYDTVVERATDTIVRTEAVEKVVEVPKKGSNAGWAVAVSLFLLIIVYILIKTLLKQH